MEPQLIFQKIPQIMADVPAIGKDRKNTQQNYNFRGIDDMYNELHGLFAKHEVFFTSRLLNGTREERATKSGGVMIYSIIDIEFTFYAKDGSCISSVVRGEAMDSGDKASNKASSTALKYALMQLLMIPTIEPKDTEIESPEPLNKAAEEYEKLKTQYVSILNNNPHVFPKSDQEKYAFKPKWTSENLRLGIETLNKLKKDRETIIELEAQP